MAEEGREVIGGWWVIWVKASDNGREGSSSHQSIHLSVGGGTGGVHVRDGHRGPGGCRGHVPDDSRDEAIHDSWSR